MYVLNDTGERMIPPASNEVSFVFARHRFAYEYASQFAVNQTILDIGCGTGYGCELLAKIARFVCGIDYNMDAIRFCQNNYSHRNCLFIPMNAEHIGLKAQFDVTVALQVIEHLSNIHVFFQEIKRVTKPFGLIIFSTPNVPAKIQQKAKNPFHTAQFDYAAFKAVLQKEFAECVVVGVTYKSPNIIRTVLQSSPLYQFGKLFNRRSRIKKTADILMKLREFTIDEMHPETALDLIAVCKNQ